MLERLASGLRDQLLEGALVHRLARRVGAVALTIWKSDRWFLLTIVLANLLFAARTFKPGIWADNDSVCHYAYLRHLLEEIYPATGGVFGYSPKFNMGVPFLLFNTPPGTYVASAVVSSILHVSALLGLKLCVTAGFLSVPVLGFAIAKTFDDVPADAAKFVALVFTSFSSELFGLEFFFNNGMLNPALGVPLMLVTIYFFRRAQTTPAPLTFRYLALGGLFFACTVVTHVLSAYMLCLALVAFIVARGPRAWGHDVLRLGVLLAVGGALAAFWLVPSAPFAAKEDAAYTWLRRPAETVSSFLDGSLFSSYFGGFFDRFFKVSNSSGFASVLAVIALGFGIRRRSAAVLGGFGVFVLGFWIALGPFHRFLIDLLPGYDRLLWYRFLTLAQLGWFFLAGIGAAYVRELGARFRPYNFAALAAGFGWALIVVVASRSPKIETSAKYSQFTGDADRVAAWLREHGDKRARIFDEFLSQPDIPSPSVNYTRHMMPLLSGFDEIGGWIYENNLAGQILMRKGVFWYSPFPLLDQAPQYNVKYIVAGSSQFIRALSADPRWKEVLRTAGLFLFENVAYEPVFAEGDHLVGDLTAQRYIRGGGYEYDIALRDAPPAIGNDPLVVKTGYLPYFTVFADDAIVATRPSPDGLLQIDLPPGARPHRLRCVWDISALRAKGNKLSLAGLAFALVLVGWSLSKRGAPSRLGRPLAVLGSVGAALALVVVVIRDRNVDLSSVGFGVRNGMIPYADPNALKVGAFDDDRITGLVQVRPSAWEGRGTLGRDPARKLRDHDHAALRVALAGGRAKSTLLFRGEPDAAAISITLEAPGGAVACSASGTLGTPIVLPTECNAGDPAKKLPGVARDIRIQSEAPLTIASVKADTGITFLEAESLRNAVDDSGDEAASLLEPLEWRASNGVVMFTVARFSKGVDLDGHVSARPGLNEVWLLTRTVHARFFHTRAEASIWIDGVRIGSSGGEPREERDHWNFDTIYEWVPIGRAKFGERNDVSLKFRPLEGTTGGLGEVDALAFVPIE